MAGSSTAEPTEQPVFYFDLAGAEAYLTAERVLRDLPVLAEWIPILAPALHAPDREAIQSAAAARGLQPVRWPPRVPFDSAFAMRAATFAKQIGRTVAFAQAAFRQAYAGGRDLSDPDNVLIASAACEMHPAALLKGAGLRSIEQRLDDATRVAVERGVTTVPAVWTGEETFHGDAGVELAARALTSPR
jgi:2-hydroxychromene-2-carboxylate isomerase